MGEFDALSESCTASGELVGGAALADPPNSRTVRVRDGVPAVTDGPFAEAKEQLAGYYVVDCESIERADRDRRARPGVAALGDRGAAAHGRGRAGDVTRRRAASRTCCASWRRRSSACSSAATGSSTPARTRCRRRCWPPRSSGASEGVPENPRGWLITVASRRLTDQLRSDAARRRREERPRRCAGGRAAAPAPDDEPPAEEDDTLTLLFLCCHPALSPASQLALTLRAVGGLTTAEIARAFLVPEATMAQRISRAKQRIKAAGARFELPPARSAPSGCASCCTCST